MVWDFAKCDSGILDFDFVSEECETGLLEELLSLFPSPLFDLAIFSCGVWNGVELFPRCKLLASLSGIVYSAYQIYLRPAILLPSGLTSSIEVVLPLSPMSLDIPDIADRTDQHAKYRCGPLSLHIQQTTR